MHSSTSQSIRRLWKYGFTVAAIAAQYGVTKTQVVDVLTRAGVRGDVLTRRLGLKK